MRTKECLDLIEVAFKLCGQATVDARKNRADTHNVMQSISSRTNDLEKCYQHAMAQFRLREELAAENGSTETHAMAVSCSELAKASIDVKLLQAAEDLFERSKHIRESLPGYVPTANFNPVLGLGCICYLREDYDEAAKLFEKVLQDRITYFFRKAYDGAPELFEEALQEKIEALEPTDKSGPRCDNLSILFEALTDSERTGHALYWLGKARTGQGKQAESLSCFLRAKIHFQNTIGKDHPSTAPTYYKLVTHNMKIGDFEQARQVYTHSTDYVILTTRLPAN
jgi:tetratricopeptide (TPR) repeat protein